MGAGGGQACRKVGRPVLLARRRQQHRGWRGTRQHPRRLACEWQAHARARTCVVVQEVSDLALGVGRLVGLRRNGRQHAALRAAALAAPHLHVGHCEAAGRRGTEDQLGGGDSQWAGQRRSLALNARRCTAGCSQGFSRALQPGPKLLHDCRHGTRIHTTAGNRAALAARGAALPNLGRRPGRPAPSHVCGCAAAAGQPFLAPDCAREEGAVPPCPSPCWFPACWWCCAAAWCCCCCCRLWCSPPATTCLQGWLWGSTGSGSPL